MEIGPQNINQGTQMSMERLKGRPPWSSIQGVPEPLVLQILIAGYHQDIERIEVNPGQEIYQQRAVKAVKRTLLEIQRGALLVLQL